MKSLPLYIIIMLSLSMTATAGATGNIALPHSLYMLPGSCNNLFTQAYTSQWPSHSFHIRVDGDCRFERRTPAVTTVTNPVDGNRIIVTQISADDFHTVSADTVTLRVGASRSTSPVNVQIIGDSYVQGAFYRTALIDSMHVPGIRLSGLRQLNGSDIHCDEGRGGWTLKDYFSVPKGDNVPYSGFMQPARGRYLGACRFWINCHKVQRGELTDFESRYQCGRFEKCSARFDPATGLPLSPEKDDLMWDNTHDCYIRFDGRRWIPDSNVDESTWSFNYSRYLEIWNVEAPDFLFETLGLNDFRDILDGDYSDWDSMVVKMKDSYLEANPDGIFAIVIPCSSCGSMNNRRGDFTARQNACMWNFRNHLVNTFGDREQERIYLVDMGITIDNDNGYRVDSEGLQTGNPHPYPNYPSMGMPLAAFIQYHRR